jgi:hypothetical protein
MKISSEVFFEFLDIYEKRPISNNQWGMRSHGMFFLWYLLKQIQPDLVIESGVYRGQSTWMIAQAAPDAKIIAIDPDLTQRFYVSKNATYRTEDFSLLSIEQDSYKTKAAFFDDHQNAYERVMQSTKQNIQHLIFDDNYPPGYDDCAGNPHLTLRDCFEMKQHQEKAAALKKVIKQYCIMPQIIGNTAGFLALGGQVSEIPAIWGSLEEIEPRYRDKMKVFYDDCYCYRWLTYVELQIKVL